MLKQNERDGILWDLGPQTINVKSPEQGCKTCNQSKMLPVTQYSGSL